MPEFHLPHDHGAQSACLLENTPKSETFQQVCELFRQLGDGSRIRLFWILCHCEECVINLSAMMGMSSPALSHHLRQLKTAGLIVSRRVGKEVYYRAADVPAASVLHNAIEALVAIRCPKAENLTE